MDKKQLQQSIDKMKKELAGMEAKLKQPERKYQVPVDGEMGYVVTGDGVINTGITLGYQNDCFEMGNWYTTQEEAERAVEKQKAYWRVVRALRAHEGDWAPDWSNLDRAKLGIYYNHIDGCFYTSSYWGVPREACLWIINNMQEDLRLIYDVK